MRFAFVCTRAESIGGSYVHVRDVASRLRAEGHEVKVFVGGTGPFTEQLAERGVPFHSLEHLVRPISPRQDLRAVGELRTVLRAYRPDLVSCHSSKAGVAGRIAGWSLRIPTLFTAHGWLFAEGVEPGTRKKALLMERVAASLGTPIVCVCEADRELAVRNRVAREAQITVVHNGMPDDPTRARPEADPPRIVSVARLDEQKDHPTLLRALASLKDLAWKLDLIGGGARESEFRTLAGELEIADRVHFHGTQKDVRPFLANAQLFALISNYEGFPRSTLEAMRAGLPVVVSDVDGAAEALNMDSGAAVPPRDPDSLGSALRPYLADPRLRAHAGAAARRRYEDRFTFERMFAETKAVYARMLGRPIG